MKGNFSTKKSSAGASFDTLIWFIMILMKGLIESVYRICMLALLKFQPYNMYVFDAGQAKMNMFKVEFQFILNICWVLSYNVTERW